MSVKNSVVAGYVETRVKEWIVKTGDPVTPGDLLCIVTYETYKGPVERNVLSEDYGTVGKINYLEGETVPKRESVCLIDLDDRYYMHRAISFLDERGESTMKYYEELLCKLAIPYVESALREEWIAELADWTLAMKDIIDEYMLDKAKAVDHIIHIMDSDPDEMSDVYNELSLIDAAGRGKIKGISKRHAKLIDLDEYEDLFEGYLDYCRKIWTQPQKEDRAHALEMIRRIGVLKE